MTEMVSVPREALTKAMCYVPNELAESLAACLPPEFTDEQAAAFYEACRDTELDVPEERGREALRTLRAAGWKVTPPNQDGEE